MTRILGEPAQLRSINAIALLSAQEALSASRDDSMYVARQVWPSRSPGLLSSIKSAEAAFVGEFPSANFRDLCTCLAGNLRLCWEVSVHMGGWDNVP